MSTSDPGRFVPMAYDPEIIPRHPSFCKSHFCWTNSRKQLFFFSPRNSFDWSHYPFPHIFAKLWKILPLGMKTNFQYQLSSSILLSLNSKRLPNRYHVHDKLLSFLDIFWCNDSLHTIKKFSEEHSNCQILEGKRILDSQFRSEPETAPRHPLFFRTNFCSRKIRKHRLFSFIITFFCTRV